MTDESSGNGRDAVDADPGAHEVVARVREGERSRGVGRVHDLGPVPATGEPGAHFVEALELLARVGILGLVGDREVRPQPLELELAVRVDQFRERVGGLGCRADAVHAGVDLEMNRKRRRVALDHRLGQRLDTGRGVHGRREPRRHDRGGRGRDRLGEHEDRCVDAGLAQLDALFDEGHAEHRSSGFDRRPSRRDRAVPVAVGLHDREHSGRCRDRAELGNVVAKRREIDLRPHGAQELGHSAYVVLAMNRTMSERATRPTTRPSSTTGTCVISRSCISVATSSRVASEVTVSG